MDILHQFSVWALPVLLAITLHEAAHGYVANMRGDNTALMLGRVSLNPLRHVDPFGTVVLPAMLLLVGGFLFGFAKPVPVRFDRLRNPRYDMVLVALAGPGANIFLALVSALLIHIVPFLPDMARDFTYQNLINSVQINVILAVFNMLPLPPLDGGRVAVGLLPRDLALPLARLERHGFIILLALLFLLPMVGSFVGLNLSIFDHVISPISAAIIHGVAQITGLM